MSGQGKKPTKQGALTPWKQQREELVRTLNETNRARHTHHLETAEELVTTRIDPTRRGALTNWRQQREGLVRTREETEQARHTHVLKTAEGETCHNTEKTDHARRTHFLKIAEGRTCHDTDRNRPSKAHSLPGDGREGDLSRYRMKSTKQGTLTNW